MPTSNEFRKLSAGVEAVDESSAPTQVIGRDEQVEALWVQVKSASARLSAPPRIGKTWFLNLALAMRPEWAGPTLFNAAECRSLREFVWELTRHLHAHGYVSDEWESAVRHWFTQRPYEEPDGGGDTMALAGGDDWEQVLQQTCGILVEKGPADCPVLMIDELPVFLDTLIGEWAEEEAGRLLEALRRIRLQYPALRMILSDAQGLQRVLERLRRGGFQGEPLDDLPPFELPALSAPDARYLAGCLLLGEQVPCSDIHAVAQAVAEACSNVPLAIRNTVYWMARFQDRTWTPETVSVLPTTQDMDGDERAEPSILEESLSLFDSEEVVQRRPSAERSAARSGDRIANGGFSALFPFSLDSLADNTALDTGGNSESARTESQTRSVVTGPLAEGNPRNYLDPAGRSFDWLDSTLSPPHRKLVTDIRTDLARGVQSGNARHVLVTGAAGTGKSHTLAMLAKGLAKGLGLSGRPRTVVYLPSAEPAAESPFDLLLACMRANGESNERLRERLECVESEKRFDALKTAFHERFSDQLTFVIADDLGAVFRTWNKTSLDNLRRFLEHETYVTLMGAPGSERPDSVRLHGWLKDRFRVYPMPELDGDAVGELLCSFASARGDRILAGAIREPRHRHVVRSIHAVSGGNCRILASLDRCLSEKGFRALEEPVTQMTRGELAPIYERRIGECAPQQSKILQALAEHQGRAVNVTELARYMFLTPQAVSRQLQELLRGGFVARTQVGRETCYELNDPLIRFVLDFKHGRDNTLPLLVRGIRRWCAVDRLYRCENEGFPLAEAFRYDAFVEVTHEATPTLEAPAAYIALDPEANPYVEKQACREVTRCLAIDCATELNPELEPQIEKLIGATDKSFATVLGAAKLGSRDRHAASLSELDEWLQSEDAGKAPFDIQVQAQAMRVFALIALGRFGDALSTAESALQQQGGTSDAAQECMAITGINKGIALLKLERFEDAAAQFDTFVEQTDTVAFPEMVAAALLNRAAALDRVGRYAEAMAALDLVTEQYGRAVRCGERESAADAQVFKATLLERLGQHDDALAACTRALGIRPGHPRALMTHALLLCRAGDEPAILKAVESLLNATQTGATERVLLAAGLFDRMAGMESTVQVAAAVFGRDRSTLLYGLIYWVRGRMSMSPPEAQRMERRLHTLRPIFDDDAEAGLVMTIADVLARTAQGDARAMLDLPIELRRLVS